MLPQNNELRYSTKYRPRNHVLLFLKMPTFMLTEGISPMQSITCTCEMSCALKLDRNSSVSIINIIFRLAPRVYQIMHRQLAGR